MSDTYTKIPRIPRDTKARHEGYLAGRYGHTGADNPYIGDTRASREWLMGLLDGRTRQLFVVSSTEEPRFGGGPRRPNSLRARTPRR